MEKMQIKTVDPLSQELLKSAFQRGIVLSWDRFERLQPQDGFLRLGLSCPYGCLHGPCRIDPFAQGPEKGFCGFDRHQMVAVSLLRLALLGVLEVLSREERLAEIPWPNSFQGVIKRTTQKLGGGKISAADLSRAISGIKRSGASVANIIEQALRLGILSLTLGRKEEILSKERSRVALTVGYGLLAQKEINIAVCGGPSPQLLKGAAELIKKSLNGRGQLVSLGEIIFFDGKNLPCVCTSGEAELVLSSGKINLLIAGAHTDPAIKELCQSLSIPVAIQEDLPHLKKMAQGIKDQRNKTQPETFYPPPDLVEEAEVLKEPSLLKETWRKRPSSKIYFVGGDDHPSQALGWIPTEVVPTLIDGQAQIFVWGDVGLWLVKKGMLNPQKKMPLHLLDGPKGLVQTLSILSEAQKLKQVGGVFFTAFKDCAELALSLGLTALGLKVGVGVPLPLWGSEQVCSCLQKKLAELGGSFTHFDHPAEPEEIIEWFKK